MKCYRCGSVMIYEKFYAPHEHFFGWRCVLCGEIVDQVILENRRTRTRKRNTRSPQTPHGQIGRST